MKKVIFPILLLGFTLLSHAQPCITLQAADGTLHQYYTDEIDSIVFGEDKNYEYVDLELPSGNLWATCNVGAKSPEEFGDYFAWGETKPQADPAYNWTAYKWCEGTSKTLTKYSWDYAYGCNDNKDELDLEDDAAYINMGANWLMPTQKDYKELYNSDNTTSTWTTQNGVYGMLITSNKNGKSLFFPAGGYKGYHSLSYDGSIGYYWTRTLSTAEGSQAVEFYVSDSYENCYRRDRFYGQNVRAIRADSVKTDLSFCSVYKNDGTVTRYYISDIDTIPSVNYAIHDYVDLGLPSGTLWATCNVGANSPEEFGDYFAWGETKPQENDEYSSYSYKWGTSNKGAYTVYKYCTESSQGEKDWLTELELEDDAATVNWGPRWRMPTREQCKELCDTTYTTSKLTSLNGVEGILITSKINGKSIFLPSAYTACYGKPANVTNQDGGRYWSRTLDTGLNCFAYHIEFSDHIELMTGYNYRDNGYTIRPVRNNK